jgi:acetyl-CoA carboxylase carboxyltransferase component
MYNWIRVEKEEVVGHKLLQSLKACDGEIFRLSPTLSNPNGSFLHHYKFVNKDENIYASVTASEGAPLVFTNENLEQFISCIKMALADNNCAFYFQYWRSGGVRLTHDRSIYNRVWGVVPYLFKLKEHCTLVSIANEMCLGAAAVYFAQGDLRLASSEKSILNLTGPGVMDAFFGQKKGLDYSIFASAIHQLHHNELIHYVGKDESETLHYLSNVLQFMRGEENANYFAPMKKHPKVFYKAYETNKKFMETISDGAYEIFTDYSPIAPTYLMKIKGQLFGMVSQLKSNPYNMIDRDMVRRWSMALDLFKSLKIPVLAAIDSPGADPRQVESDRDVLMESIHLVKQLIDYPYKKMGLVMDRSFGGSGILSLLKEHGSECLVALEETKLGVMGDSVIDQIVAKKEKLKNEWEKTKSIHREGLKDMIDEGIVDHVLAVGDLKSLIAQKIL